MPCELLPLPLHFYADMSAVCVAKLSLWTAVISSLYVLMRIMFIFQN